MNLTCPCCHARIPLEAAAADDAARSLMALLAGLDRPLGVQLIAYLGLFRPRSRALGWARALRLAGEVLELEPDPARLAAALDETVQALRRKRDAGAFAPLRNHNYLREVLRHLPAPTADTEPDRPVQPRTRTAQALCALEEFRHGR